MNENQHIESDRNEHAGDRPLRTHFNRTIVLVLAVMVVAVLAAYLLFVPKRHTHSPNGTESAPATSPSPQ